MGKASFRLHGRRRKVTFLVAIALARFQLPCVSVQICRFHVPFVFCGRFEKLAYNTSGHSKITNGGRISGHIRAD